jgi:hypothetical protein
MHSDFDSVLWEDLGEAQSRIRRALDALQAIQHAIQDGLIDQPTRQDSKRLNRLAVLADLLYTEIGPWADELAELTLPRGNGRLPATSKAP